MTTKEALLWGKEELNKIKVEDADISAEVLLYSALGKDKEYLYAHPEEELIPNVEDRYREFIARRTNREPVAYITGEKEFFGITFKVDRNVLIPRPETEILVKEVIREAKRRQPRADQPQAENSEIKIADIGTGSGCIATSLAKNLDNVKIFATDISESALNVAKENAVTAGVANKINFLLGDKLEALAENVDIIVSNPPYVLEQEFEFLSVDIKFFEPKGALLGGVDGLDFYKGIITDAPEYLNDDGKIFFEIGFGHANKMKELIGEALPGAKVEIKKDLAKKDRIVIITL